MAAEPTEIVADFLAHTAPDQVTQAADRLVAEDATYISLNFANPELKRIMPWTGTSHGRQAFIDTFSKVASWWEVEDFQVSDLFGSGEDVAVFGEFTYRSVAAGKRVHSPFAIHAKVKDSRIVFFQFMEDTFATGRSFSPSGTWTIKNDPEAPSFEV
jgi:ketosteroid isomerase-like protein